jgi:hypothetical protein
MIADMSHVDTVSELRRPTLDRRVRPAHIRLEETVLSTSAIFNSNTAPLGLAGALLRVLNGATGSFQASFVDVRGSRGANHALSSQEMLVSLNSCGISISNLAAIADVSRPTIYSWLGGTFPSPEKQERIALLHRLLHQLDADSLRILSKVWLRRTEDRLPSVYEVMTAGQINIGQLNDAIRSLKPMLDKLTSKPGSPAVTVAEQVDRTLAAAQTEVPGWDTMPPVGGEI